MNNLKLLHSRDSREFPKVTKSVANVNLEIPIYTKKD
jgi:hypothetical protein